MALRAVLWGKAPEPHTRPSPLQVKVVATREMEKTISWDFSGGQPKPRVIKINTMAAISDGNNVAKLTLFQEFSKKVEVGRSYLLKNYDVRGSSTPYNILINRDTQFNKNSPVHVNEGLMEEGRKLLYPDSTRTSLSNTTTKGFMTLAGSLKEVSFIRMVTSGRGQVPVRTVKLQNGSEMAVITMWREAAAEVLLPGDDVIISHVRMNGETLQSTTFTKLETITPQLEVITAKVMGVGEDGPGTLSLDLSDGSELQMTPEQWEPFDKVLDEGELYVKVERVGNTVKSIEAVEAPIEE